MSDQEQELSLDIDDFASELGFEPSDRSLAGETPFLRLGMVDFSGRTYEGVLDGREALLAEYSIGSPGASEAFGGSGVSDTWFTLFRVKVEAPEWPRLTIHPREFSEGWATRLFHRDDYRLRGFSERFDEHYRVRAAKDVPEEQVRDLIGEGFVAWYLDQGELVFDVESNVETGDSVVVARRGLGLERAELARLLDETRRLIDLITRSSEAG
ncbi:MAG: hypothetical protein ACTHNU_17595 [Gaiellales bacterium]